MTYEITGAVKFSPNTFIDTLSPISNVQIVLKNTSTNIVGCVSTDSFGNFRIYNIPAGNYILVESYGYPNGITSPLDYGSVSTIDSSTIPTQDPLPSSIIPIPAGNSIFSLTPNVVNLDTVSFISGSTVVNFIDSTLNKTPLIDPSLAYSEINQITIANGGTFGINPPGTPANTSSPYPYMPSDFIFEPYSATTPVAGAYTVLNIGNLGYNNGGAYNFANLSTGDESGNCLVICNKFGNFSNENIIFSTTVINLMLNSNYLFNFWVSALNKNIENESLQIYLRVLDSSQNILYDFDVYTASDFNFLTYQQVSYTINTLNNSTLTLILYTFDSINNNNLFVIDDIALNEIYPENPIHLSKTGRYSNNLDIPEIYYDIKIQDISTLVHVDTVTLNDILPSNCSFKLNSAVFNGVSIPGNFPFTLTNLNSNAVSTLSFTASVVGDLSLVPCNTALCEYSYELNSRTYNIKTKSLPACLPPLLIKPDISLINSELGSRLNEKITFTVDINNFYNEEFTNTSLIAPLNDSLNFIDDSIFINGIPIEGATILPPYGLILGTLPAFSSNIVKFSAMAVTVPSPNLISTTVDLKFKNPTTKSMTQITSNNVLNSIYQVILNSTFDAVPSVCKKNEPITFYSTLTNVGNVLATSIVATMTIPEGFKYIDNSLVINTPSTKNNSTKINSYNSKMLNLNGVTTILIIPLPNLNVLESLSFSFKLLPIDPQDSVTEFFMNYSARFSYNSFTFKTSNYTTSSKATFVTKNGNTIAIIRSACPCVPSICDKVSYTVIVKNDSSSFSSVDCTLFEKLSCNTTFIKGSLCVNGQRTGVVNPALGILLSSIPVGGSFTVTYCVKARCVGTANSHSIGIINDGVNTPYEQLSNISRICINK